MSLGVKDFVELYEHLAAGAVSAQDLTARTGHHLKTSRKFLQEMQKRGFAHIAKWDTTVPRNKLPMYKLGAGRDAPKPKRIPADEVNRQYRTRKRIIAEYDPFYAMCRSNPVAVSRKADRM